MPTTDRTGSPGGTRAEAAVPTVEWCQQPPWSTPRPCPPSMAGTVSVLGPASCRHRQARRPCHSHCGLWLTGLLACTRNEVRGRRSGGTAPTERAQGIHRPPRKGTQGELEQEPRPRLAKKPTRPAWPARTGSERRRRKRKELALTRTGRAPRAAGVLE